MRLARPPTSESATVSDAYEKLVPEGEYVVGFFREVQFRRPTWETIWTIADEGEHFGRPLYCSWPGDLPAFRVRKRRRRILGEELHAWMRRHPACTAADASTW